MNGCLSRRALMRAAALTAAAAAIPSPAQARSGGVLPTKVKLAAGSGREIEVTRWRPVRTKGTVLFSHGAMSSPAHYDLFILPWVSAGYEVWAPLHVDSTQHPRRADYPGLKQWAARIEDMRVLADHVGVRRYVAAGHSYGGLVALTLGGATPAPPPGIEGPLADSRVAAVVALSPPGTIPGFVDPGSYASVAVPALIQTGTRDIPFSPGRPSNPEDWRGHLLAYEEPRAGGDRYALVIDGVDHYFGGTICNFERPGPPQTAEAAIAADVARRFMDVYLLRARNGEKRFDRRLSSQGPVRLLKR